MYTPGLFLTLSPGFFVEQIPDNAVCAVQPTQMKQKQGTKQYQPTTKTTNREINLKKLTTIKNTNSDAN